MGLQEGRVVHDGGEQGGEGPQQEGGEELGDDWILETGGKEQTTLKTRWTCTATPPHPHVEYAGLVSPEE